LDRRRYYRGRLTANRLPCEQRFAAAEFNTLAIAKAAGWFVGGRIDGQRSPRRVNAIFTFEGENRKAGGNFPAG
jgi:hypothetical protein